MSAYAPQAIHNLFNAIQARIPQAQLGGIVGDQAHSFGYHLARNDLPSTDYSVQLPPDRLGDGGAASALDVTLPPDLMITCTSRLIAAAKAGDQRLAALREFCGTTNGTNPHPYDLASGFDDPGNTEGWDNSHLWHIHLSIYRMHANDESVLLPIADVFAGITTTEDDLTPEEHKMLVDIDWTLRAAPDLDPTSRSVKLGNTFKMVVDLEAKVKDVEAKLDRIIAKLGA